MNQAPKRGGHDTRSIESSPAILRPYHGGSRSDQRNEGLWPSRKYSHRCHLTKTESNCGRPDRCEHQSPHEGSWASIEQASADGDANAFPSGEERQAKGHSRLHGNERLEAVRSCLLLLFRHRTLTSSCCRLKIVCDSFIEGNIGSLRSAS